MIKLQFDYFYSCPALLLFFPKLDSFVTLMGARSKHTLRGMTINTQNWAAVPCPWGALIWPTFYLLC